MTPTDLLDSLQSTTELRQYSRAQLQALCQSLRTFLIQTVSQTGGHLSSNLGTVELTVALHHVFNTPHDRLIWDVGHQSYAHKILTGRRDRMHTLRQAGGLSGFPKRSESPYDAFGTAHSSTSISAALGMAVAARQQGIQRQHIAVIGDGAMTAGMAFEALNNAGTMKDINLIVILNDNDMSISPPVGALNKYLARLLSGSFMQNTQDLGKAVLEQFPSPVMQLARKVKGTAKHVLGVSTIFEEFGFDYCGPIDGHDLDALVPILKNLSQLGGLHFLHVITQKGKGYALAEADPIVYHGPGKFDPSVGIVPPATPAKPTFTQVFSDWVVEQAKADHRLVAITPAMREGSGLVAFEKAFPNRYFDVGIAEQHAVTFAAGLACEGLKPVVAIYSTFLQRAYDQLIHDVALQDLDVTFALDRAGLVGADGATHAGNYDIAFLRCIPNMVIATPSSEAEARTLLSTCYAHPGPVAVRYPRGIGLGAPVLPTLDTVPIGKGVYRRQGQGVALLVFGTLLPAAMQAAEAIDATVVDMRFAKPLDEALVLALAQSHERLVTIEDGCTAGGAGGAVLECLQAHGLSVPVQVLGIPDRFIDHGDQAALWAELGLNAEGILASIQ